LAIISYIDGPNRDIYLSADTVGASIHPIDIYKEMRTLRKNNEELRKYDVFLSAFGNVEKGGGKFTERYVRENHGTRIIPYDTSHTLTITGIIITDDGQEGISCFDRSPLTSTTIVDINYTPPQVEIIKVITGSGVTSQDKIDIINGVQGLLLYSGEKGPGIWVDDSAFNIGTVLGTDGTQKNPVSTIAAATTLADTIGVQTLYLLNGMTVLLEQSYVGWTFVGVGASNAINLNGQNVRNSSFNTLILTGQQGGSGLILAYDCWLTNLTDFLAFADGCWLTGDNSLRAGSHIYDKCKSAIAGNGTPALTLAEEDSTNISVRHYSGGLQLNNGSLNDTVSYESDGQLIIDSSCDNLVVSARGNMIITDNGIDTKLTGTAAINNKTIAESVWDEAVADHQLEGSTGHWIKKKLLTLGNFIGLK